MRSVDAILLSTFNTWVSFRAPLPDKGGSSLRQKAPTSRALQTTKWSTQPNLVEQAVNLWSARNCPSGFVLPPSAFRSYNFVLVSVTINACAGNCKGERPQFVIFMTDNGYLMQWQSTSTVTSVYAFWELLLRRNSTIRVASYRPQTAWWRGSRSWLSAMLTLYGKRSTNFLTSSTDPCDTT